jgi:fucose permease
LAIGSQFCYVGAQVAVAVSFTLLSIQSTAQAPAEL